MSEKHYPYIGGSFDRIVFDGDGSVWVPEPENAKLRERIHELEMEGSDYFYRTAYAEDANRTLESDNAKLRELLADTLIDPRDYCAKYGIDYDGWDSANDDIDRRLRELGVTDD